MDLDPGRIGIILPDTDPQSTSKASHPDLDPWYPFQPHVKLNETFSIKFQYAVQNIKKYDTYGDDKIKKCRM